MRVCQDRSRQSGRDRSKDHPIKFRTPSGTSRLSGEDSGAKEATTIGPIDSFGLNDILWRRLPESEFAAIPFLRIRHILKQ